MPRARGDDLYFDLTGNDGKQIIHIETVGENYEFSYMGGALKMHTTKAFVAEARAQNAVNPDGVSTDGFVFEGDTHALDAMLQLPESALLPYLSRALGVRGITGTQFPASLALHKTARQSAEALGITVEKLDTAQSSSGYCQAYPNSGNECYGMCGYGCSCWAGCAATAATTVAVRSTTTGAAAASGTTATTSRPSSRCLAASSQRRGGAAALVAAAAFAACSPPSFPASRSSAITNATDDDGDPSVVALLEGNTLLCTATLIAPRVLLTAAHCLGDDSALPVAHFGAVPGTAITAVTVGARCRRHPAFDADTLDNDVALALLADDRRRRDAGEAAAGRRSPTATSARRCGWSASGVRRRATRRPRAKAAWARRCWRRCDGRRSSFAPTPSQTCEGDSGGPAFATLGGGAEAIVGVTSSGDPACAVMARDMRVDASLADFIAPFVAATAARRGERRRSLLLRRQLRRWRGRLAAGARRRGDRRSARRPATAAVRRASLPRRRRRRRACRHAPPSPGAPGPSCDGDADCDGQRLRRRRARRRRQGLRGDSCFVGLPGFCPATFDCLPVAGGSGAAACFAKPKGGCSIRRRQRRRHAPLVALVMFALAPSSKRSVAQSDRRAPRGAV